MACLVACSSTQAPVGSGKRTNLAETKHTAFKPIELLWKADIGRGGAGFFQPIIIEGAVYAATRDGKITKVDARQGTILWQKKVAAALTAGVGSDSRYTAVGNIDGLVYTLDEKGELLWKADIQGELLSPPLVGYGRVLVRAIDGRIHAFDAQTGTPQWVFQHAALPLILHASLGMRWAGPTAFIAGFPGGSLAAISAETGQTYWETPIAWPKGFTEVERVNDVVGTPSLVGRETCAVTFQGQLACLDAQNGEIVWQTPLSSSVGLDQSAVNLVVVDNQNVLRFYNAVEGQLRWKNTQFQKKRLSTPLIVGEQVLVGDQNGEIYFLSLADGKVIASLKISRHAIVSQPVLIDRIAVVQTQGGELRGFALPQSSVPQ